MLARVITVVVCLSVRLYVTHGYCIKTAKNVGSRKQRHVIAQGL